MSTVARRTTSYVKRSSKRTTKRLGRKVVRAYFRSVRRLPFPARMTAHMGVLATVPVLALNALDTLLPWLIGAAAVLAVVKFLGRR